MAQREKRSPPIRCLVAVHRGRDWGPVRRAGDHVPGADQLVQDLRDHGPANFVLEPPGFLLHRWQPQQGMTTHLCAIGDYPGPWPFYDAQGLID